LTQALAMPLAEYVVPPAEGPKLSTRIVDNGLLL
jgi:hypothetical protein